MKSKHFGNRLDKFVNSIQRSTPCMRIHGNVMSYGDSKKRY